MAKVTDEMLMAYADGALSALARAKIEAALQSDPDVCRRLEVFRETGAPLSKLYARPMLEPVPERLRNFVLHYPLAAESVAAAQTRKGSSSKWVEKLGGVVQSAAAWFADSVAPARWQLGAVSAGLVAVSLTTGWLIHDNAAPSVLVAFEGSRVFATGALERVLETSASGKETRIGGIANDSVTMRTTVTFKNYNNSWCREFEIVTSQGEKSAGLGCREDNGKWALQVSVPAESVKPEGANPTAPAVGGKGARELDAVVDRVMQSDALGREGEAAVLASGWK